MNTKSTNQMLLLMVAIFIPTGAFIPLGDYDNLQQTIVQLFSISGLEEDQSLKVKNYYNNNYNNYILVSTEDDQTGGEFPTEDNQTGEINPECTDLSIVNITASGFETDPSDYHPPSDAIDGNPSTWWSNNGKDPWVEIDLGEVQSICGVSVEWNKGDERKYSFDIEVSEDGNDYEKVFEGNNKEGSSEQETYPFEQEINGQYVKLPITATSSDDGWVSIKEVRAIGLPYQSNVPGGQFPAEDDEKTGSEYICNKLLETCEVPTETNVTSTETGDSISDDIAKKYFEQDGTGTRTPVPTPATDVNATEPTEEPSVPTPATDVNATEPTITQNNVTEPTQDNFEVYENASLGISMSYPAGWEKTENNTQRFSVLLFLSPPENVTDQVRERLLIRINNQPTDLSLDDYSKKVNESLQNNTSFSIINFNSTVLSDNPAYTVTGISTQGNQNLHVIDEWTIKNGTVYRIAFYSEEGKSDIYLPLAQKMIDSFRITK